MTKTVSLPKKLREFFMDQNFFVYKKGETIIRQGDEPSGVYFIEKGFVRAQSVSVSGEEKHHFIYKKGEIFPLGWAFNNKINNTQFDAISKTILRRCPRNAFISLIEKENIFALNLSKYLVEKIALYAQRLSNLETANSYPRIIIYLIFIAKRFGREKNGKILFDMPINQKDIANSINVTRETASKELNNLAKKKLIISSKRSSLVIKDLDGLEKELHRYYEINV